MAKLLSWLVLLAVVFYATYTFVQSPQGRTATLMVYGSSLVRPGEVGWVVDHLGLDNRGWVDVDDAYVWVQTSVRYMPDTSTAVRVLGQDITIFENERFKSPSQTLADMAGDCEDKAILLASMLRRIGYEARVVLGTYQLQDKKVGHAWVELKWDGKWTLLDPSSDLPSDYYVRNSTERYRGVAWFTDGSFGWY